MKWIDISKDMPEKEIVNNSIACLVYTKYKEKWDAYYDYEDLVWRQSYSGNEIFNVTHWIDLNDVANP